MAFREQKIATLSGVADYGIFCAADYIPLPARSHLRHDDERGVIAPMESKWSGHRKVATLPSDPSYMYMNAPADPAPGYHLWQGWDVMIDNARILPNPPRERGQIIGRVQHINYTAPHYLNGHETADAQYCTYGGQTIPLIDPVNSLASTLGYALGSAERTAPVLFSPTN